MERAKTPRVVTSEQLATRPWGPPDPVSGSGRLLVRVVLAIATVVAVALRLPFLGHQGLWLDEVFTREIIRESSLSGVWRHVKATESTPPLYYILGWLLNARSTAAMRAIPAVALVAAVPVGYFTFRRFVGTHAALAVAAILAVNPMLVWYGTDARSYGLFVLTGLMSLWTFSVLLVEDVSTRRFVLWAIASVACVWTHYFGAFLVGAEILVFFVVRPAERRAMVAWAAGVCACLVPLVPLVVSQSSDERASFIEKSSLTTRVSEAVRQSAVGPNVPRSWLEGAGLAIVCIAVAVATWWAVRSRDQPPALLVLVVVVCGAPLLLAVVGITDRFYARNLIVAVPLVAALAAPALLRWRAAPLIAYLVVAVVASVWVATDWRYEQADWKNALARAEAVDIHAPVVAVTPFSAPVVQTYLSRSPVGANGLLARQAWLIVEPRRAAGHRALGPAPAPNIPSFVREQALEVQGFRLILQRASRPTRISSTSVPGTIIFPGRP